MMKPCENTRTYFGCIPPHFLRDLAIFEQCPALRHIEAIRGVEFEEMVPQKYHFNAVRCLAFAVTF